METNSHNIDNEKVISQEDNKVLLEFVISEDSDFFNGHFPEYKLLPAVAQIEITTRFARKYFGTKRYISHIKRAKFSAPVRPGTTMHLELKYNEEKGLVAFNMADANVKDKIYCSGTYSSMEM